MKVQLGGSFQLEKFYGASYKFNSFQVHVEIEGNPNEGEDNFQCHARLQEEAEILFKKDVHGQAAAAKKIIDDGADGEG
jgi:hypothetical protein